MHEYHEAIHIIEHAIEEAKSKGKSKVTKINLVIGESSGFSGETIKMHFEDAAEGTICEGAEIAVKTVKTMLRCPNCRELFARKPFEFACPHCGTDGVPSEVGKEMAIESIEAE
ncbi:MAG TPA: hydrogenase maturation nickel metallochaperone HypA [Ruminococcaceae bacterium]|nr:hydrogenase maturation nickel metallochaperone HypA [Oscillospiraceae bacterium]